MHREKLERGRCRTMNAHQSDTLYLWDSPVHAEDRQNLTLEGIADNTKFTIYGLTLKQLGELYVHIAQVLGKAPEPTIHHLREIHELIGNLVAGQDA